MPTESTFTLMAVEAAFDRLLALVAKTWDASAQRWALNELEQ